MKIAMTIASGDAERLEAQLAFHLNAGVDLMIATGGDLDERVSEILDSYARQGHLVRVSGQSDRPVAELETLTTSLAAVEHGADWLIRAAPTEFWWPRGASLKDVLVAVPPRYGVVQALFRRFQARTGAGFFAERMTVRESLVSSHAGKEPMLDLLRPIQRLVPGSGAHDGQPLRAWYPVEVLQFPLDSGEVAPDQAMQRGLEDASLIADERLRDALRTLREGAGYRLSLDGTSMLTFPLPTVVDDAEYAVECAAIGEVDLDRLDQQIRDLEDRIAWLEQRFWPRMLRAGSRLARGRIRRHS